MMRGSRKKITALYLYTRVILVSWYVETDTIGAIDCKFLLREPSVTCNFPTKEMKFHFRFVHPREEMLRRT